MRLRTHFARLLFASLYPTAAAVLLLSSCMRSADNNGIEVNVMTFNIRYGSANDGENSWPNRSHMVIDVVSDFAPDVLGLQEALRFQIDELLVGLGDYDEIGVGRDDGREAGEYAAILYRSERFDVHESGTFWFSDTPDVPGSTSWGNNITRICTWAHFIDRTTSRGFYVYNVHLDHESQPSRERSVELLASRILSRSTSDPVIVTGDFNAGEDNPVLLYLTGKLDRAFAGASAPLASPELRDTYRVVHPDSSAVGTFNSFRGVTTGDKIDAVLVSDEWQVSEATIIRTAVNGRYPSDHFPVVAVVSLPDSPGSSGGDEQPD
jgi:endonuclease/exonuclease/phosphatase family metal-dependent hydrolase